MPEDADQDILEALVCLWPTTRSNRAKLTCQGRGGDLGLGLARFNFYFGRAFAGYFLSLARRLGGPRDRGIAQCLVRVASLASSTEWSLRIKPVYINKRRAGRTKQQRWRRSMRRRSIRRLVDANPFFRRMASLDAIILDCRRRVTLAPRLCVCAAALLPLTTGPTLLLDKIVPLVIRADSVVSPTAGLSEPAPIYACKKNI